jgi:anthraniloyl-CoA monooxygenase
VWRAAGLDKMSQEEGVAWCERLFADQLDGHGLMSNAPHLRGSAMWITFPASCAGSGCTGTAQRRWC